nr:GntR family transcriptional regulator [Massilia horti]
MPGDASAPQGATQRIVDSITNAIAERRLMPGTKLSEQKIGDIFKVSRTVVRQAFNQLSRDRLVVLEPARGAFVATPTVEEARDVFEARGILEAAVTKRLCAVITDEQIKQLREHLELERAAVANAEVHGRTRLLADFHLVLARMLGNQVLVQMLSELLTRSSLIALMHQSSHSAEVSHSEHLAIVDAFEKRDVKAALRLLSKHLDNVQQNLRLDPQRVDLADILK